MKTSETPTLYTCSCCKRSLPAQDYYVDKKTGKPSDYCKECRRAASQAHRQGKKGLLVCFDRPDYPVITTIHDPVLRMELIMHSLQEVARSVQRKSQKVKEAEFLAEKE